MARIISSLLHFALTLLMFSKSTALPTYIYSNCSNNTMFTNHSQYKTNLDLLLQSLSSNSTTNRIGFYMTSVANGTSDAVYGLFLCRGDQNANSCSDCVKYATVTDLPKTFCPNKKLAIIWYEECMVRYSNESFFGRMDVRPYVVLDNTKDGTGKLFSNRVNNTLYDLGNEAANDPSGKMFATKVEMFPNGGAGSKNFYALAQCTPDLSITDCKRCLSIADDRLFIKLGSAIFQPSCNVRYETYPFFNYATENHNPLSPPPISSSTQLTPKASRPPNKGKANTKVIISIVISLVATTILLVALGICLKRKRDETQFDGAVVGSGEDFIQYNLATLQFATSNFSDENKLGEGGFGRVYKGILEDGQDVAVKRLSQGSGQGVQEFKNEVLLLAKLQHRNLVRLLGFCLGRKEKLLVYEYVPNKSLDYFLLDSEKRVLLDWGKRYKIIGGIARGMLYLHEDSQLKIIHRDLKAGNVLLDEDMNPKVADFGMARIFAVDQSQANTKRIVGTYGYMSPEYAMHGQFSTKSDVYSFGVLVLEIISGKKNSNFYQLGHVEDLLGYAWKQWKDETPMNFVDPIIRDSCSILEVLRCMHLGLLCVQEAMFNRPSMATIVRLLETNCVSLRPPQEPGFFIKSIGESSSSKENISLLMKSKSMNDVTVTEIETR